MNSLLKCGWLIGFSAAGLLAQGPEWSGELRPSMEGSFPEVPAFKATFAFGWSGIQAASGEAAFTYEGDEYRTHVTGKTEGLAAQLWKLEVDSKIRALRQQFTSIEINQREQYSAYRISITGKFQPDGVWRLRLREPSKDPGNWKFLRVAPSRDMVSAMLFVRSQPLANGDDVTLVAFPGDSPYLVKVHVEGRETLRVMNEERAAIRLRLTLQKIETSGPNKGKLVDHTKFRSGEVWVSDDEKRFPLRAEVSLFIGYVYAELTRVTFAPK